MHKLDPSRPKGYPDLKKGEPKFLLDNTKARTILGLEVGTKEESAKDILASFKEQGDW